MRLVSDHVDFYHYYAAVQIWLKNVYVDLGTDVGRLEVEHGMRAKVERYMLKE